MGASMPKFPAEDVQRIAKEVLETFTPVYIKWYGLALIEKMKADADTTPGPDWRLTRVPAESEPLKEGYLTKQGIIKKNWKKRWFRAMNVADNYEIRYYEKDDLKKQKGTIQMCGYRISELTKDEEIKEYGKHCLKFTPWGRRRSWFIRCDDAESLKEWRGVFEYSAWYARAPLNPDPVMATAFKAAYRATRWRLWVWSWWSYDRTEEEQLAALIVDRCEDDCMEPVYASIKPGKLSWKIREQVQSTLDKTVGTAVAAGWKACLEGINKVKPTVNELAEKSLGDVIKAQVDMKNKIRDAILDTLTPGIKEVSEPVMVKVMEVMMTPIQLAYEAAIFECFVPKMGEVIEEKNDTKSLMRSARYYWGMLYDSFCLVRALTRGVHTEKTEGKVKVSLETISVLMNDVRPWQVEGKIEDHIRELTKAAIYTFDKDRAFNKDKDAKEVLQSTVNKFVNDAMIQANADMVEIFEDIIAPPFRKLVNPKLKAIIEPFNAMIPEPFKMLIDIDAMVMEIMTEVVRGCITAAVEPGSKPILEKLKTAASAAGFDGTTFLPSPPVEEEDDKKKDGEDGAEERKEEDGAAAGGGGGGSGEAATVEAEAAAVEGEAADTAAAPAAESADPPAAPAES